MAFEKKLTEAEKARRDFLFMGKFDANGNPIETVEFDRNNTALYAKFTQEGFVLASYNEVDRMIAFRKNAECKRGDRYMHYVKRGR